VNPEIKAKWIPVFRGKGTPQRRRGGRRTTNSKNYINLSSGLGEAVFVHHRRVTFLLKSGAAKDIFVKSSPASG
jgi:hypothetical protein